MKIKYLNDDKEYNIKLVEQDDYTVEKHKELVNMN